MAADSLSQLTSPVKSGNLIHIDFLNDETPVVLSTDVARHFQRRHKHVLDDIRRIQSICPKSFFGPNFRPIETEVTVGFGVRKNPAYQLTRDAFSLLVMGMTGKAAILWKLRYIEAFNALEAAALESRAELARESGYLQGLDEGRASVAPLLDELRGETARLFWRLGPTQKRRLRRVMRYHAMGLSQREIGRLLDIPRRSVRELLKAAEALGELPQTPARLVQGNLLEVGA